MSATDQTSPATHWGLRAELVGLPSHITREATKQGAEQLYNTVQVIPEGIAEVIGFAVNRPRHLAIYEILLRPAIP